MKSQQIIYVLDVELLHSNSKGNPYQIWTSDGQFLSGISRSEWLSVDTDNKVQKSDSIDTAKQLENEFECPKCGEYMIDFPEECRNCGTQYNW